MSAETVDVYVDPGCPWTWLTTRWLVDVAEQRDLTLRWWPFSLALLNEGRPVPAAFDTPEMRARVRTAGRALAVVAALGAVGDHGRAGRFYTEFGRRLHDGEDVGDADLVESAADAADVPRGVLEDAGADETSQVVRTRLDEALRLAGPDIGSPVLRFDDADRGIHGPIVSARIAGDRALRLFDALVTLQSEPTFFEIKRGRTGPPRLGTES